MPPPLGRRTDPKSGERRAFAVVGVGASAGGLQALQAFLGALPAEPGFAIVVITHQHPSHVSLLPELLAKDCQIPVEVAQEGDALAPNHVYVGPPGKEVAVVDGVLRVVATDSRPAPHLPIDHFFRSLADDQGERAVCVVLSGTGSDGTLGLRAVKGNGGLALVQDEHSARYAGMPLSAAGTLLADAVLAPEQMPAHILGYVRMLGHDSGGAAADDERLSETIQNMLQMLRDRTGHDLAGYKPGAIRRRIERRMRVHELNEPFAYLRLLQANPHELDLLLSELLINVTSFFRDPAAFVAVEAALEQLVATKAEGGTLRLWVTACSTGEEAYSLAILTREVVERSGKNVAMQIFATDLDGPAIEQARVGVFPEGILADVGSERLARYFQRQGNRYRIKEDVREVVVFAVQNLLKDPPFTKLDLVSCRNLLIYLKPELQQRLIPVFHYSLMPGGLLLLGTSESTNGFDELFESVNSIAKLYARRETVSTTAPFPIASRGVARSVARQTPTARGSVTTAIEKLLIDRFAPPTVIINQLGEILYTHGKTGDFLELAPGAPRSNLYSMAREGLRGELPVVVRRAAKEDTEVAHKVIGVQGDGNAPGINLLVRRVSDPEALQGLFRVSFGVLPPPPREAANALGPREESREQDLESELRQTRDTLQGTIEELQTSNEELQTVNGELQSMNEELQSTNEELETSKEELQSLNEELQTVNGELQTKMEQLSQVSDDMQNLLNSTEIATLFLDRQLKIKRYTEQAREIVSVIPSDVGRSIGDLVSKVRYDALVDDARRVLESLLPHEVEVQTSEGQWRLLRMRPYRTSRNVIDGVVITFVDIDRVKRAELLAASRALAESIVQTVREPLVVLDRQLRVVTANSAFLNLFETCQADIASQLLTELDDGVLALPALQQRFDELVGKGEPFQDFSLEWPSAPAEKRRLILNARALHGDGAGHVLVGFSASEDKDPVN